MKLLKFLPKTSKKAVLDMEMLKVLSESEAFAWWFDYLSRISGEKNIETLSFDDDYLANVTLQAS